MEKNIKIRTPDKKTIDGILRGTFKQNLIVLTHGLCGNMNEAMHYNAARFFEKHGFATFRFNLYSWEKTNRKLHECTLKTHGQDIDTALRYLRSKGTKKIFIIGHSYGFPSILHSKDRDFDAVISWDGSCLPHDHFDKLKKTKQLKGRVLDEGFSAIMGEKMAREANTSSSIELLKHITVPVKYITVSGKSGNHAVSKKMYKETRGRKELKVIRGATHNFTEDGKQEELYVATLEFLKRFV